MKNGRNGSSARTTWIACLGVRSTNQPVSTSRSRVGAERLARRLHQLHVEPGSSPKTPQPNLTAVKPSSMYRVAASRIASGVGRNSVLA